VGDHVERSDGAFQLGRDLVTRVGPAGDRGQALGGLHLAGDRDPGELDVRHDEGSVELVAAHRVHPRGDRPERAVAAGHELPDRRAERGVATRGGKEGPGSAEQDGDHEGERDEGDERGNDSDLHAGYRNPPQPVRERSSLAIAGAISNRSPITTMSANSAIGASGSRLTATMVPAVCIPTLCWMAPETPSAR